MHSRWLRRLARQGRRKGEEREVKPDLSLPGQRDETWSVVQIEEPVLDRSSIHRSLDQTRNEIRLLLVKPGENDEPLHCEFVPAFLADAQRTKYETISYAWGDPTNRSHIFLHGVAMSVPASAAAALRRMRLVAAERILWIDAVCINQYDLVERQAQVALMHLIFSNGQKNLVWLGDSDDSTSRALHILRLVLEHARNETDQFKDLRRTLRSQNGTPLITSREFGLTIDVQPLIDFYERPWFQRLWVLQEAALSEVNVCICGPFEFSLDDPLTAAAWLEYYRRSFTHSFLQDTGFRRAATLFDFAHGDCGLLGQDFGFGITFSRLMRRSRYFESSDLRDYVFGILGLYQILNPRVETPKLLSPDYTKSVAEVFRDATLFGLRESKYLRIFELGYAPDSRQIGSMTPSWVPKWQYRKAKDVGSSVFSSELWYCGRNRAIQERQHCADPNVLSLLGCPVDIISAISGAFGAEHGEDVMLLEALLREIYTMLHRRNIAIDLERMGRTLMAGVTSRSTRATPSDCLGLLKLSRYIRVHRQTPPPIRHLNTSEKHDREKLWDIARFYDAAYKACLHRRFFVTSQGRFGLGPKTMQPRDTMVVLYGCRVPIVLRPQGKNFELVGVCYVDGIMDGEAVRKHEKEGGDDIYFDIV